MNCSKCRSPYSPEGCMGGSAAPLCVGKRLAPHGQVPTLSKQSQLGGGIWGAECLGVGRAREHLGEGRARGMVQEVVNLNAEAVQNLLPHTCSPLGLETPSDFAKQNRPPWREGTCAWPPFHTEGGTGGGGRWILPSPRAPCTHLLVKSTKAPGTHRVFFLFFFFF